MKALATPLLAGLLALLLSACEQPAPEAEPDAPAAGPERTAPAADNPLLTRYLTPFQTPPFHRLEAGHFLPALEQAITEHEAAIASLVEQDGPATFDNSIQPLESGRREIARIADTWFGLFPVTDDHGIRAIAPELAARLAEHHQRIHSNRALFERIESARDGNQQQLDGQQQRLAEITHARFMHGGATLDATGQQTLGEIDRELSQLRLKYASGLHEMSNDFELLIEDESRLDGLPEIMRNQAIRSARERGHETGWLITLHPHSLYAVLRHATDRTLRRDLHEAWHRQFDQALADRQSASQIVHRMAILKARRAELLGHESHFDYQLWAGGVTDRERLRDLIDRLSIAAGERIADELEQIETLARADGIDGELEPWDWWYYAERLRETELDIGESDLREWFALDQVRDGAFALANRLWGLSYHVRTDLPILFPDVETWEIRDVMGEHLGVLYLDYRHRGDKHAGAWTWTFRPPHEDNGERIAPVIASVASFPPTAAGTPTLLGPAEVRRLFGQFGRALHELFTQARYPSLAASELPAEFHGLAAGMMARWALQPEVLRMYAFHHETGSMIGDPAIEAVQRHAELLAGMETLQLLAALELQLALHDVGPDDVPEVAEAETRVTQALALPGLITPWQHEFNLMATHTADSYQSLWSDMLAADAFAAFEEATVMDREIANHLREEILNRGNTRKPMDSFRAFRGRDPEPDHLLRTYGLTEQD